MEIPPGAQAVVIQWTIGRSPETVVDGTADGVLTSWPQETEIWLYRRKNNFPALLMYRHGNGRVIVSNYYSDYAHGHGQLHRDERNLLRDLLSWAWDSIFLGERERVFYMPLSLVGID